MIEICIYITIATTVLSLCQFFF